MNDIFFNNEIENEDKLYARIRDNENNVKKQLIQFWNKYKKIAPPKYLKNVQFDFHQKNGRFPHNLKNAFHFI